MSLIENKLHEIKEQIGVYLTPCDYFKGIQINNNKKYFNIILEDNISESNLYCKLLKLIEKGIISKVEPNGYKRLAIFF